MKTFLVLAGVWLAVIVASAQILLPIASFQPTAVPTITLIAHTKAVHSVTSAAINTTTANLLVACVNGPDAIVDSKANTWSYTAAQGVTQASYVMNPTTDSAQTFTGSGGAYGIFVAAFHVPSTFSAGTPVGASTAGATSLATGSVTPSGSPNLIISCLGGSATAGFAASGSMSITDTFASTGGTSYGGGLAYKVQASATAINPSWSWTSGSTSGDAVVVSLQ